MGGSTGEKIGAFVVEVFHAIGGAASEKAAAADHPEIVKKVVVEDIENAKNLHAQLREEFKNFLKNGGDLSVLSKKHKFETIFITTGKKEKRIYRGEYIETEVYEQISEEKVFKYMIESAKSYSFGSEQHLAVVIKYFSGKITVADCQRIFEKGILISWQSQLAELHMIEPLIFEEFKNEKINDDIRASCNRDGVITDLKSFRRDFLGI